MSNLDQEFSLKVKEARLQIDNELNLAREAFDRAVLISDNTGVPFETDIYRWETNKYIPDSFREKRVEFLSKFDSELDLTELNTLTEYDDEGERCGFDWEDTESSLVLTKILGFSPVNRGYDSQYFTGWQSNSWSSSSFYC